MNRVRREPLALFERHFQRRSESECWFWEGALNPQGYGVWANRGRARNAHAWAFLFYVGKIRYGLEIDHTCHTRHCVNPAHLRAVTHSRNLRNHNPNGEPGYSTQVAFFGELRDRLEAFAERDDRSISSAARFLLSEALTTHEADQKEAGAA